MDNNLTFLNACRNGQKNIVQIFLPCFGILIVVVAELCQTVMVVRMFIPIFFPKKLQGDMLTLHLF